MSRISVLLAVVSGLVCVSSAQAASLQVSPISLDLTAPARTSSVTLRNNTDGTTNVQIRAYKWTQVAGIDQLMPANDVIVSPPAATLRPDTTYTIRVAHLGAPSQKIEQSYRLLIDELPDINVRRRNTVINFATQYSIPVFFSDQSASADLRWKMQRKGKELVIEATNSGTRHAKVANLSASTPGARVSFGSGLNGYVLPGSTMRWAVAVGSIRTGDKVTIKAEGDDYAVNQSVVVSGH